MTNEELKVRIGANIARLRKEKRMTQAELAERLNYSDKAVSKWERAESMPDVLTLTQLAEQFGTDVNELLSDPSAPAAPAASAPEKAAPKKEKTLPSPSEMIRTADKGLIQKLSCALVWVVAVFIWLVLDSFDLKYSWMVFVLAVMANAIVLLSLRSAWKLYGINRILVSIIMWTALIFLYLTLLFSTGVHVWRIFLMGLLGQAAIIGWFKLFPYPGTEEKKEDTHE